MRIRPATPDDAAAIASVNIEGWRTAYGDLLPADELASLSFESRCERWLEILQKPATNKITFVAESAEKIIGFASCGPDRTGDARYVAEIYAIYVLSEHHRQGIGTALVRSCIGFLREHGLNSVKVWVLKDNPFRRFYERLGGKVVEEKTIAIGETRLWETAYGWTSLALNFSGRTIRPVNAADQKEWLRLRQALWPEESVQSLVDDMQVWLQEDQCRAFAAERSGCGLCGFLEAAIRPCNANGAIGRFGYIEGWFVDPDVREQGIGAALVRAAADWIKEQGCQEILSDARIDNRLSQTAHAALGFVVVERLVHYRKMLD